MQLEGIAVLEFIEEYSALLDAELKEACISSEDGTVIVTLKIRPRADRNIAEVQMIFSGVRRFDFYYNGDNFFYTIDRYKALALADAEFYVALDPYNEGDTPSDEDRGVVVARRLHAVVVHGVANDLSRRFEDQNP